MKTALKILAIILLVAIAFAAGRIVGIRHAIEDSEIWTVDVYNPESPDDTAWNGYDQLVYINLDGNTYEHGMTQC